MLERLNEEIKRRTRVVRIFPNPASCLCLVRALCAEVHEGWLEDPPLLEHGVLEGAEERTADRRLTDLSHESEIAQLDVQNPDQNEYIERAIDGRPMVGVGCEPSQGDKLEMSV